MLWCQSLLVREPRHIRHGHALVRRELLEQNSAKVEEPGSSDQRPAGRLVQLKVLPHVLFQLLVGLLFIRVFKCLLEDSFVFGLVHFLDPDLSLELAKVVNKFVSVVGLLNHSVLVAEEFPVVYKEVMLGL